MLASASGFVNIVYNLIFAASESPWRCPARWTSSFTLSTGRCARCRLPAVKSTYQTSLPHILSDLKPQMVGLLMTSSTFGRRKTPSRFEDFMMMDRGCFRMKNETVCCLLRCVLNEPSLANNGVYKDKDCWIKYFINICILINTIIVNRLALGSHCQDLWLRNIQATTATSTPQQVKIPLLWYSSVCLSVLFVKETEHYTALCYEDTTFEAAEN